jgi:hypothetical protein
MTNVRLKAGTPWCSLKSPRLGSQETPKKPPSIPHASDSSISRYQGVIYISAEPESSLYSLSQWKWATQSPRGPNLLKSSQERHTKYGKRDVMLAGRLFGEYSAYKFASGVSRYWEWIWRHGESLNASCQAACRCRYMTFKCFPAWIIKILSQNLTRTLKYIKLCVSKKYKQGTVQKARS